MHYSKSDPLKGLLYSLGGVTLLSTNFVTAKYALRGFNPETFSVLWTTAAAIYAFGIATAARSSRKQIFPQKNMKALVGLGIAAGIGMILSWSGLSILDPVFSSFLWRFFPVMTILSGVLILKERLSVQEISAMSIMMLGSLWSLTGRWQIVGTGVLLTMLSVCINVLQLVIAKSQTNLVHPNVLVAYRVGVGAVFTFCWLFATGKADFNVEAQYWLATLIGAFLGPCASFLLTFRAYRYWSLSQSSIVLTIQPLLVLPMAYFFLKTLPERSELTGGCVILLGSFWLAFIQAKRSNEC